MLKDYAELSNCRVLLADGSPAVLALLKDLFAWVGAETVSVSSGQSVREILQSRTVDLLVLDLAIPGASSEEILHWLHENQPDMFARTLVTSWDRNQSERFAAQWGRYPLDKPFSLEELCLCCSRMLSGQAWGIAS